LLHEAITSSRRRCRYTNFHQLCDATTFSGPLAFIQPDGTVIANVGWSEVQGAWEAHLQSSKGSV
jgi:hypothetical protein